MPSAALAGIHADRDGDRIFDDLEARLGDATRQDVLVSLRKPASAARLDTIEHSIGGLGHVTRLRIVDAFAAQATSRQIRALAARADVAHVEENSKVVPLGLASQAAFGITRAREDVPGVDGNSDGHAGRYSKDDLVAAVIDSGIDTTMPDLPPGKVLAFKDLTSDTTEPYDEVGHGSSIAAVLAGSGASGPEGRGVAPGAALVAVKVIKMVDGIPTSDLGLIAQGIQWVIDNRALYGIDAINLSIGDPVGCGDGSDVASKAVDAAVAAGLVVVVAAGNAGPANCTIKSPAAAESALTVGAMADTSGGGFTQAWFSSRGPTADGRMKPDVSAPYNIVEPVPGGGYAEGSGTSTAAPFVTGTALLMLQANPALNPAQIKDIIERTAVDWGKAGPDYEYGYGRLDAYAALQGAGLPLAVPPAVPSHVERDGTLEAGETVTQTVDVTDEAFPLAITMTGPDAGFDLALRNADGAAVGATTKQPLSRQEDLSLRNPAPGMYTITVTARAGSGAYVLDASGAFAPADSTAPELTLDPPKAGELSGGGGGALGDFPGVVVRVLRDGTIVHRVGAAVVLGRWSVKLDPPLPDGAYTVDVVQGDVSGNVSRVPARALVVDTGAPAVALTGPTGLIRSRTPRFEFSSEAGATFECRLGSGWAGCTSPVTPTLVDGTYDFSVRATDAAGNVSDVATTHFTVDATPPAAPTITAQAAGHTVALNGTAEASATITVGSAETIARNGEWTIVLEGVEDGLHTYAATATDAAGNTSSAASTSVTVDTTVPVTMIRSAPPRLSGVRSPLVSFFSTEGEVTFECRLGGDWASCASPHTLGPLADGSYTLQIRARDAAGNVGDAASAAFTVDGTAPGAPVFAGVDRMQNSRRVMLNGTAEPGTTIEIAEGGPPVPGGEAISGNDGRWSVVLEGVPDGRHGYVATATDAAGNTSPDSASRVVLVDTVAPEVAIVSAPSGLINTPAPTATFSATEQATFECRVGTEWAPCASPTALGPLTDGTYTLHVRATDPAGNTSAEIAAAPFTVDTSAPATTIGPDGSVRSEAGARLECRVVGGAWGACTGGYGGGVPGTHVLEARATDVAGNVGPVARHEWTVATVFEPAIPPLVIVRPPPKLTLAVPTQRLSSVLKSGLKITVGPRCSVVLAHGKMVLARRSGTGTLRLKLPASALRSLATVKRVRFTLTASAPGATTVKRTVTLKR